MAISLYQVSSCPFCARVRIVLDEKGLPYHRVEVDLNAKPAALVARHPRAEVPLLVDGDLAVYESRLIAEYLDERYPGAPLLPTAPAARARARLLFDLCDRALAAPSYALAQQTYLRAPLAPVDDMVVAEATQAITAALARVAHALADRPFLLGAFSLADLAFAPFLSQLNAAAYPLPAAPPALRAWADRLADRPSIARHTRFGP